jgi:hypothetical protein
MEQTPFSERNDFEDMIDRAERVLPASLRERLWNAPV